MKNQVIKVLTRKHGKEVLNYWESKGIKINGYTGEFCEQNGGLKIYYGIIKGNFSNYTLNQVVKYNAEIIELPTSSQLPNRGDEILVWDKLEKEAAKKIFLSYIEGAMYPVITVSGGDENCFKKKQTFYTSVWKNFKIISKEEIVELTMEDISAGKGVGIKPELIRIKK